jgi:succinoglycan biosynthesis transport protein ExoP
MDGAPGLTNVLAEGLDPLVAREFIRETGLPGLHILPSGPRQHNVTQILHLKELGTLIDDMRPDYDFILIDSPPAFPLTDARLIAQHADGVILVIRAGETTAEQSVTVQDCFLKDGTPVFGSILNGWNAKAEDPTFLNSYMKYAIVPGNGGADSTQANSRKRSATAGR